ncbi:unannotated protein [freshwater metagenome]|uniref:Unannotated protein n=1 Tax=freshwater metagenome TaxID=449393 RepID=A0A6J7C9C8_9ZZZZ
MPTPSSLTSISTQPAEMFDDTFTVPPGLVYLMALSTKLLIAETTCNRSPVTV